MFQRMHPMIWHFLSQSALLMLILVSSCGCFLFLAVPFYDKYCIFQLLITWKASIILFKSQFPIEIIFSTPLKPIPALCLVDDFISTHLVNLTHIPMCMLLWLVFSNSQLFEIYLFNNFYLEWFHTMVFWSLCTFYHVGRYGFSHHGGDGPLPMNGMYMTCIKIFSAAAGVKGWNYHPIFSATTVPQSVGRKIGCLLIK